MAQFGSICALPEGGQVASAKGILSQARINEFCGFWEDSGTKVVRINVTTAEEGWFGLEVSWRRNSRQVEYRIREKILGGVVYGYDASSGC